MHLHKGWMGSSQSVLHQVRTATIYLLCTYRPALPGPARPCTTPRSRGPTQYIFPGACYRPHPGPVVRVCRCQVPGAKLFPAGGVASNLTHSIALYSARASLLRAGTVIVLCRPRPSSKPQQPPATRRGTARSSDAAMIWHHTTTADRGGLRTYAEGLTS